MARMIPPQYEQSTASGAEKRIFHLLENDPDTEDWFVLHSLGLTHRSSGPYGEIDFVVLVPSGAVVCLEVKGGRVSCENGCWKTTDRFGAVKDFKRSPFLQARDGMFSLLRAIEGKFGKTSDHCLCLFSYAVVFPDVEPPPQTPEFELWEAIGRDDLRSPISRLLLKLVSSQRKKTGFTRIPAAPESCIRDIRQFLRPDFDRVVSRHTVVCEAEASLVSLTEDQYVVLDMISDNERCLIEGAAGTGKTLLALEYARRQALVGKRVLLVCFNRLLADCFEQSAKEWGQPSLVATSYFRYLRSLVLASQVRQEFESAAANADQSTLFSEVLPFYALLAAEYQQPSIDVVVIDEAQDLLKPETIDVISALLKGGIAGGRWYAFGDFTRQCLYGNVSAGLDSLASRCPHFARTKLQTNCRNTRRIGEETALLSGFTAPPYKLGQIDGLPVDYRYWRNREHQLEKLTDVVRALMNEGFDPRDVVLVSHHKFADSVASKLACATRTRGTISSTELRSGAPHGLSASTIAFATVQAFKGMESSAIIFCDVEQVENEEPQALLYTGMSRARSLLIMMIHDSAKEAIAKSLVRKLQEGWKS